MSGYLGTKAVLLSTTTANVGGDSTIGGDLTVDTNTLYVDSTNNRVGIGNAAPTQALDVTGDIVTSGGVYLGGTGSANKLDDVETGTWTPTSLVNGFTVSLGFFNSARYVKIGKIVNVTFDMVFGSNTYASSYSQIGGLPFGSTTSAVNGWYSSGSISGNAAGGPIYIGSGTTSVYLFQAINSNATTTWNVGFIYETS